MSKEPASKPTTGETIIRSCVYQSLTVIKERIMRNETLKGLLLSRENKVYTLVWGNNEWCFCEVIFFIIMESIEVGNSIQNSIDRLVGVLE